MTAKELIEQIMDLTSGNLHREVYLNGISLKEEQVTKDWDHRIIISSNEK